MSAARLRLSEGSLTDLDAVMRVMEVGFDPAFGEAWTAAQCAGLLPMPGVWLTLAREGEEAVGFALARIVAGEAELLLLAVKPGARRRGVGKALLQRFELVSRTRGAEKMHLEVRDGNAAAELYVKAGFSQVGRRPQYYRGRDGQIHDALTLAKPTNI